MTGLVLRGSKNVFTVQADGEDGAIECRIKGKILKGVETYYNPLAPGDRVVFERDAIHKEQGFIISLEKRRNAFTRTNQKGRGQNRSASSQILAANVDLALCLTTPLSPPFRPRFIDRLLVQAEYAGITPVIVCNKCDLPYDEAVVERLRDFVRIGYQTLHVSSLTGAGMDALRDLMRGKCSVLAGQSGVGKSSLINSLVPGADIRTGRINEKYDRGNHTTTMASLLEVPALADMKGVAQKTFIIDTPGVRRFVPDGIAARDIVLYMKEFAPFAGTCAFGLSCTHQREPGCRIIEAVDHGVIHEDRYTSFLHIRDEI
ncbi:MAG: ribosome small subunit-dependent GTPase A [Treponema sp.]|jgi:ribosome biogenesis GTPase|nr:ribosome small subunit-dependent GTPase A [Treponema sp.]